MASRLELHEELCNILESRNVYFQPPESVKMNYPAIVYSLSRIEKRRANNSNYDLLPRYEVILIDKNPDSVYVEKLLTLPYSSFDRQYKSNNLNHNVFTIYY